MHYYGAQAVSQLHGRHFQSFLSDQLPERKRHEFNQLIGDYYSQQYTQQPDLQNFQQQINAARLWCKHAMLDRAAETQEAKHV